MTQKKILITNYFTAFAEKTGSGSSNQNPRTNAPRRIFLPAAKRRPADGEGEKTPGWNRCRDNRLNNSPSRHKTPTPTTTSATILCEFSQKCLLIYKKKSLKSSR